MKKVDFIKKLSELTKIDVEEMTKAIASDQEDIEITMPEIQSFTKEELSARDLNTARAGNHAAVEMAIKDARNKMVEQYGEEANFQGKTMENLLETALKVGEKKAGVKPSEQLIEKENIIKALQKTNQQLEAEKTAALQDKDNFKFNYQVDSTLVKKVPHIENSTFTPDEYIALWKRDKEIVTENGIITYKINGVLARDEKTQNPISIETDFESFLTQKGVTKEQRQGRGEGDRNISGKTGIDGVRNSEDFYKYCEDNKITSKDGMATTLSEVMKKNPGFVLE